MVTETEKARLDALDERLKSLKEGQEPEPRIDEHYSQAQQGWRMVIELVAGILIGFGIGYGLDYAFGTLPLFLVLFVLLGLAAGIKTMMRTAQEINEDHAVREGSNEKDDTHGR
jgi:ATP synthase protein I